MARRQAETETSAAGGEGAPLGLGDPAAPFDPRPLEAALTGFEWSLWRLSAAFIRWQGECLTAVAGAALTGQDAALLHVVAHQGKAKGLSEIGRLLGRDDVANVQYAIKRLLGLGLIERVEGRSRRETIYRVAAAGAVLVRRYGQLRRRLLVRLLGQIAGAPADIGRLGERLDLLTALYDTASRGALSAEGGGAIVYNREAASGTAAVS
jgi:predicted MarR family transcription regulator